VTSWQVLSYDQTINRRLVHKRALGDVLVSDSVAAGPGEFLVAAQVPRTHSLWNDRSPEFHDPLAMLEAGRQATFVVAHRHLLVPYGPIFIMQDVDFSVHDLDAFRVNGLEPLEGVFRFKLLSRQERSGGLTAMSFEADLLIANAGAMTLRGGIDFIAPDEYAVLRAFGRAGKARAPQEPTSPIDPALRSRSNVRNVVIGNGIVQASADAPRYPVIVDPSHPSFYDHPLDHAPGSLLLEAARQCAIAEALRTSALRSPSAAVTACKGRFDRFAEHDAALDCSASVPPRASAQTVRASVDMHQQGQRIAHLDIELTVLKS
jgi:hypothetical protein